MIGGKRIGDNPDANVLLLDLEKKTIISRRDLNNPRDFPIVIPTGLDEVVVIGGGGLKTAEKRAWNELTQDHEFKPCTIQGMELIEDPSHCDTALPSFVNTQPDNDTFPDINSDHTLIFGNEIDCFLIEVPKDLIPYFYPSPMRLQQKTGQVSIRFDPNTIYFAGGTDTTRTKISQKSYKMFIRTKEIVELAKLKIPRYFPAFVNIGSDFYVIGGKTKGKIATPTMEKLSQATETQAWEECPPMKQARFGHVAWTRNKHIYVIGGTTVDDGRPLSHCEVFDATANTWSTNSFTMSPALNGASSYDDGTFIYLFGGQDHNDIPSNGIFKINASNPTVMEKLPVSLKVARVDCFVFRVGNEIVVLGGSTTPLMEVFDASTMQPKTGLEDKSQSFFNQLSNYTSDIKLENCSTG